MVRYSTALPQIRTKRVLFLHGTFVHPENYHRLFELFPTWDFVCPTLIGHGLNSCEETGTLDADAQVEMLLEFVRSQDEDYDILMGHSFGGTLAVHLNEKLKFARVVLLAPAIAPAPSGDSVISKIGQLPLWAMKILASLLSRVTYPMDPGSALMADLTVTTRLQILRERLDDPLAISTSPICDLVPFLISMRTILEGLVGKYTLCSTTTTIILGEHDRLIDMPSTQRFLRSLRVSPVVIPGVGHEIYNENKFFETALQEAIHGDVQ